MDFKLKAWSHAEGVPPTSLNDEMVSRFGPAVARMMLLTPPLIRAYHRMAFDLAISPRGRTLAMCALTYVMSPMDYLPASSSRPAETLVDDLYVAWRVLSEITDLHGTAVLERHWRSTTPVVEVLARLESLPALESAVPVKTLSQINRFLQVAAG